MKYFGHESNAHSDSKLVAVLNRYGFVGYGLYWYCNEVIAEKITTHGSIECRMEYDTFDLASIGKIPQRKVNEILAFFVRVGLFTREDSSYANRKLLARLDRYTKAQLAEGGVDIQGAIQGPKKGQ